MYTVEQNLASLDAYPDIAGWASGYIRILIRTSFPYYTDIYPDVFGHFLTNITITLSTKNYIAGHFF